LGTVLMAREEEDWMRVTGARKAMRRAGRQRKRVALRARILRAVSVLYSLSKKPPEPNDRDGRREMSEQISYRASREPSGGDRDLPPSL
jgi:hypothetical protein